MPGTRICNICKYEEWSMKNRAWMDNTRLYNYLSKIEYWKIILLYILEFVLK